MVLSLYSKQRILFHYGGGITTSNAIRKILEEEGIHVSRVAIWRFLRRYDETQCLGRKEGSGRPSKITTDMKIVVQGQMEEDDETTAYQLHKLLTGKGYNISISTILRCRKELGWTYRGTYLNMKYVLYYTSVHYLCFTFGFL